MKKILTLGLALLMGISLSAQTTDYKQLAKERKQQAKFTQSELHAKASKEARKETKRLKKQGWMVSPGGLPMEKQLDRSYQMQLEDYIMGEGMSIGETYGAAKMQAMELAKMNLATQMETTMKGIVNNAVANKQLTAEEAVSVTQTIAKSVSTISQRLGRITPAVEVYRTKENKNKEVLVRIAYSSTQALATVKNAIRDDLENQVKGLGKRLDDVDW